MTMTILYQDKHLIAAQKEPGVLSESPGLPDAVAAYLAPDLPPDARPIPSPLHRLDRDVGGILLLARDADTAAKMSAQFARGETEKEYLAVVRGDVPDAGTYTDLLYHDRARNKTYVVTRVRRGVKEARLAFTALARASAEDGETRTLVRVRLFTGRTHQIRVQFASRGTPLVGDAKYGGGKGMPALFSALLAFRHPTSGKRVELRALPEITGEWARFRDHLTTKGETI